MTAQATRPAVPIPLDRVGYLIATAARAPSVHNTQPWRFKVRRYSIDLYADVTRKLRLDPLGREMTISCGAALFGLRLAIRSIGYQPVIRVFPDPAQLRLLARVRLGVPAPITETETDLLAAIPHRHTHRGPFALAPLPGGLLPALQHDARAEGAALAPVVRAVDYQQLAGILGAAGRRQDADPRAHADMRDWTRDPGSWARDGVPGYAFAAERSYEPGRLPQRDFDLGRGFGLLPADGPPAAATVVLLTARDSRPDWLAAGQALHRLLLRAASRWVFASLYSQPLEAATIRTLVADRLGLPGSPQLLLQLGVARMARPTARRAPGELIDAD